MEASEPRAAVQRRLLDLIDYPREELAIELKGWLDLTDPAVRADVARALLALANHGGGYLIFGFDESDGGFSAVEPEDLARYTQDEINGICARYAEPAFHCGVHRLRSTQGGVHVVVDVPGDHRVPIRSKRGGPEGSRLRDRFYYVRAPGPESAPITTSQQWDELLERCLRARRDELVVSIRSVIGGNRDPSPPPPASDWAWADACDQSFSERVAAELADERPSRYQHGTWTVAYEVIGDFTAPSLGAFRRIMEAVQGRETGWPPWWYPGSEDIRPRAVEDWIECWMKEGSAFFRDAGHSDFWRAHPEGRLFLLRGYQEDSAPDRVPPGTVLDLTIPVWRMGECLLHSERLSTSLGGDRVRLRASWRGLRGRKLSVFASTNRILPGRYECGTDSVTSSIDVAIHEISGRLPELARDLVEPLYTAFDFFEPPAQLYQEEIEAMQSRK